ncbi:MAG TPA: hypothetical protein LFW20_03465 [Rickettsia endosymbiont of Omalisus fontisbellaquei]|nr:hypothetical protein [Rickettsia endosymbiont of Omalisus fontisbellaquei]
MSKDNQQTKSPINENQIKEIISGARNDIRDIEGYVLGQLKNQIIADKKPIDINSEDFKKAFKGTFEADPNETSTIEIDGKKEVVKNNVINVPATILAITEKINDSQDRGASSDNFVELKQEMEKFSTEFREAFTSNEKINNLIKNRFKQEVINEAVPFSQLIDAQVAQMNMGEKKDLVNNIYKNIEIPDKLYEDIVLNGNNGLKNQLAINVIGPEIQKAFGNPPITLKNSSDKPYEVTTLDSSKLTPENIENFTKAVDNKLKEVNDRLIINKKIFEDLKQTNPSISNTQTKQFENFLSKLDTQSLEKNKESMVSLFNGVNKKAELSPLEKIYTTITGQSQEEYQAKKVEKILTMEYPNYKVIDDTKSYKSSLQTPTPVQIKQEQEQARHRQGQEKAEHVKQALNTPTKTPTKPPRPVGKYQNLVQSTKKNDSQQHGR